MRRRRATIKELQSILNVIHDFVLTIDPSGIITVSNDSNYPISLKKTLEAKAIRIVLPIPIYKNH